MLTSGQTGSFPAVPVVYSTVRFEYGYRSRHSLRRQHGDRRDSRHIYSRALQTLRHLDLQPGAVCQRVSHVDPHDGGHHLRRKIVPGAVARTRGSAFHRAVSCRDQDTRRTCLLVLLYRSRSGTGSGSSSLGFCGRIHHLVLHHRAAIFQPPAEEPQSPLDGHGGRATVLPRIRTRTSWPFSRT